MADVFEGCRHDWSWHHRCCRSRRWNGRQAGRSGLHRSRGRCRHKLAEVSLSCLPDSQLLSECGAGWYVAAFDDSKLCESSSVIIVVAAYLIGSIPWGYLIVRWKSNEDIRSAGSGATGATNVMRRAGRVPALLRWYLMRLRALLCLCCAMAFGHRRNHR